jgi:hypothetical protein
LVANIFGDSAGEDDSHDGHCAGVVGRLVRLTPVGQERMADPKVGKAAMASNDAGVQARNTIHVAMEDLAEEDRKELEHELKEDMAERQCKKLACLRNPCHGIVKKANTAAASETKLDSPLSPKDLVHTIL